MSTASAHLPSLRAPVTGNEVLLTGELRTLDTRRQIAIVRSIAAELEHRTCGEPLFRALYEQLVEELARLGCRSLEAAAAMARVQLAGVDGFAEACAVLEP